MIRPGDSIPNGWFWDGEQQVYHDGTGNFYIGEQWYARPDLLASQPFPKPPTKAEQVRMEAQRLTTPWPTYGDAWRAAKAGRWLCRRWLMHLRWLIPLVIATEVIFAPLIQGPETSEGFHEMTGLGKMLLMVNIVSLGMVIPCFWRVYHRHMRNVDTHKARAFSVATYGAVAVTAKVAANGGHLFRQPAQHVMDEYRRFTP